MYVAGKNPSYTKWHFQQMKGAKFLCLIYDPLNI